MFGTGDTHTVADQNHRALCSIERLDGFVHEVGQIGRPLFGLVHQGAGPGECCRIEAAACTSSGISSHTGPGRPLRAR